MVHLPIYISVFLIIFVGSLLVEGYFQLLLRKGKALEKQGRHTDAYNAFQMALRGLPPFYHRARAITMMKISLAAYHAGLLEQSLDWSRRALGENPPPLLIQLAHSTAANALSTMNRYDEAESHLRAVWEYSNKIGNSNRAAHALVQVATLMRKRGNIEQSLELTQQAMGSGLKQRRLGYLSLYESFSALGRFEEARAALLQARQAQAHSQNHHEMRSQGVVALGLVDCEANLKNGDAAWQYLQEARQLLGHDERLGHWCEAGAAKILAIQGRTQEAMDQVAKVASTVEALAGKGAGTQAWPPAPKPEEDSDDNTIKVLLENLGRATFEMRQYPQSKDYWARYLSLNPAPLSQTLALYFLGECCLNLGDRDGARAAFQKCVELNIPSYRAKLSWQRLQEMGVAAAPA